MSWLCSRDAVASRASAWTAAQPALPRSTLTSRMTSASKAASLVGLLGFGAVGVAVGLGFDVGVAIGVALGVTDGALADGAGLGGVSGFGAPGPPHCPTRAISEEQRDQSGGEPTLLQQQPEEQLERSPRTHTKETWHRQYFKRFSRFPYHNLNFLLESILASRSDPPRCWRGTPRSRTGLHRAMIE